MGFLDFLTRGLKKTRSNLVVQVDGISGKLTPETLEELEEILILSDVGVRTAGKICSNLAARVGRRSLGDGELRLENHRGILAYGREEIHVSGGVFLIKIAGRELELRAMTGIELLITGRISQITLE